MRIGVVGFLEQSSDAEKKAGEIIRKVFDDIKKEYGDVVVVTGLIPIGISLLAYLEAKERGWRTVGIAPEKAEYFDQLPVDEKIIAGTEWGDEAEFFLSMIDMLIVIGGSKYLHKEIQMAKEKGIKVIEFDL